MGGKRASGIASGRTGARAKAAMSERRPAVTAAFNPELPFEIGPMNGR
jgi:hypothetical protein